MSSYERNVESGCCTGWVLLGRHGKPDPAVASTSQIEPENSDAREMDRVKGKHAKQAKHIELLNQRVPELKESEQDLMEKPDRLQEVANGKNAGGEKVMEEMRAEIIQLKKRLKRKTSKLFRVEKDAKERNDRKETSIKRLEATVAELRRLNEDGNREISRRAWSIRKPEERVDELNQQVKETATMAEMRRLLRERTTELSVLKAENQRNASKATKVDDPEMRQLLQERTAELSILKAENQRNASKAKKVDDLEAKMGVLNRALQDKIIRISDLEEEVQSRRPGSGWKGKGTEQADTTAAELNQRLREEMAKVSEMKEAARRKEKEVRELEAKVAELRQPIRGEASRWKGKGVEQSDDAVTTLNQRLQEETAKMEEAARRKEKETKGLEAKMAELRQRLRRETEASQRKERDMEHLEAQKAETERRLHEKTVKLSNLEEVVRRNSRKEKDTGLLEARVEELERRLQEKTANMAEVVRQNSRKERESKRLETRVADLELRLHEKTIKLSNMEEASRQSSRKGESSEQGKVTELTAKLSSMEEDARRREQKNRDLSATNQKQRDEINQLKALVKTAGEQASGPPSQALVRKADSISAVEVADLVRMLNAQVEQVSTLIADSFSYRKSPGSREGSVALNELRDYLGSWLFNDLSRRTNKSETENDPLIMQIALQTVLVHACSRIINHWNPPFWNDGSIFFRGYSNTGGVGNINAGTWSAVAPTMSQSKIREANVKYLREMLVKVITAVGGSLPSRKSLPPEYQEKVEDIAKRALELHHIVSKEVTSMDLVTYTIPSDTQFDPSQMEDTEGNAAKTGPVPQDRVICTLEMGLQYRKRIELGKPGGEQFGVTLKPKVVLSAALA